ncbi:MAG: GntR family transcriptional regulator [Pyrinomonadaceae bacterium]
MEIKLTPTAEGGPTYMQVRRQIEERIKNNEIASGDLLPAPVTLAQKLSVDKGEVQRAYFELEQSGLVSKKTGKDFLGKEKITYVVK